MAYRKLGRTNKHRRSMLANLTKDLINNERIENKIAIQINYVDCQKYFSFSST